MISQAPLQLRTEELNENNRFNISLALLQPSVFIDVRTFIIPRGRR